MMGHGHAAAAAAIVALVVSAAFLVWVADRVGNPYQKMGKAFGWIALVLSALLILGSISTCISMNFFGGCPRMKGMQMMGSSGMGEGMGEGMGMPMMRPPKGMPPKMMPPMMSPPPAHEGQEAPEK